MSALLLGFTAMLLLRALLLHHHVGSHQVLRSQHRGVLSCELRRAARLASHRDVDGARTLPTPMETRTLVWRCAGLPWRTQTQSVGLPNLVASCISTVDAAQFDALFSPEFRVAAPTAVAFGLGSAPLVR
jgi:hypothetical protein